MNCNIDITSKLPVQEMASRSTICDFKEKLQSEKKNFSDVEAKIRTKKIVREASRRKNKTAQK